MWLANHSPAPSFPFTLEAFRKLAGGKPQASPPEFRPPGIRPSGAAEHRPALLSGIAPSLRRKLAIAIGPP
jgi:hypothetical protein